MFGVRGKIKGSEPGIERSSALHIRNLGCVFEQYAIVAGHYPRYTEKTECANGFVLAHCLIYICSDL